jgi:hypothetical protein
MLAGIRFDMSGDEFGWLLAIGFSLIFATASGAVAYFLSRAWTA